MTFFSGLPISLQTISLLLVSNVFMTFAWVVYFIFRSA